MDHAAAGADDGDDPVRRADKRDAVIRVLADRPDLSDRAIAKLCGVSACTVYLWEKGGETRSKAARQRSRVFLRTDDNCPVRAENRTRETEPNSLSGTSVPVGRASCAHGSCTG